MILAASFTPDDINNDFVNGVPPGNDFDHDMVDYYNRSIKNSSLLICPSKQLRN